MPTLHTRQAAAAAVALLLAAAGCAPPHPATITPAGQGPDVQHMPEEVLAAPVDEVTATDRPVAAPVAGDVDALTWTAGAPLPEQRTEVSATTDGRYIYLAGGFGPPAGDERATAPRAVWRYDPAADEWSTIAELPEGIHHAALQYHDGRLFVLGGFRETSFEPVADVRILDLATSQWHAGAPMPTPRGAAGWAMLDGRIHVVGGNAAGEAAVAGQAAVRITEDRSVNVHEAYDPATDTWVRLAPMPTPRNHLGAAAHDGRLHAVLGRADGDYTLTTHEIYDAATDSWTAGPPVPTGRSGVAVLAHAGHIYAFGGERLDEPNRRTFDDAERFDPRTNQWQRLPPMTTARHGLGAAAVRNAIHVISGGPGPAFTFGSAHERIVVQP
jgi:N-acetylneuraminic acid mutarotase